MRMSAAMPHGNFPDLVMNISSELLGKISNFDSQPMVRLLTPFSKHAKADGDHVAQNSLIEDAEVEATERDWENIVFSDEE
jgi:hypothetical protein